MINHSRYLKLIKELNSKRPFDKFGSFLFHNKYKKYNFACSCSVVNKKIQFLCRKFIENFFLLFFGGADVLVTYAVKRNNRNAFSPFKNKKYLKSCGPQMYQVAEARKEAFFVDCQ